MSDNRRTYSTTFSDKRRPSKSTTSEEEFRKFKRTATGTSEITELPFTASRYMLSLNLRNTASSGFLCNAVKTVFLRNIHASSVMSSKVAVVLSGCGVYDGSEVHEASATWVHLSRGGAEISMFAPNIDQMHAIDHTKGEPMEHNRNVLVESARIARGKVESLDKLLAKNFDAVIFPGGFGAAKNLCSFAVDQANMKVNSDVERVIKEFHSSKKPIGMCCIAPVLAAKVVPGCEVTVGSDQEEDGRWPYAGTAGAIGALGSKHIKKNVTEVHVDEKNKIVTTPAFMCETKLHEIFDGIGKMVENVLKLSK